MYVMIATCDIAHSYVSQAMMRVYKCIYIYIYMYIYICLHVYIHMSMYIHTHIYIYSPYASSNQVVHPGSS